MQKHLDAMVRRMIEFVIGPLWRKPGKVLLSIRAGLGEEPAEEEAQVVTKNYVYLNLVYCTLCPLWKGLNVAWLEGRVTRSRLLQGWSSCQWGSKGGEPACQAGEPFSSTGLYVASSYTCSAT